MEKNLVVQSNKLIEAHYKQEYSVQEQRTVLWLISEINKADYFHVEESSYKEITISAQKYAELMGIRVDNVYRDAKKIGEALMSKVIAIPRDNGGWLMFNWMASMEYKKGEGVIEVSIAPKIIPYIIQLKEQFTSFRLGNILYLRSSHAIKLYQILAQYKKIGERTITVDELKSFLGLEDMITYKVYSALKRKVLEISKREINQKTDLTISYKEIKKSRKVVAIVFKIISKPTQETQAQRKFEAWVRELDEEHTLHHLFRLNGYENDYVKEHFSLFVEKHFMNYEPKSTEKLTPVPTD